MQDNIQLVEGFGNVISRKTIHGSSDDYRGLAEAWTTELWFQKGQTENSRQDLIWETQYASKKRRQSFLLLGKALFFPTSIHLVIKQK